MIKVSIEQFQESFERFLETSYLPLHNLFDDEKISKVFKNEYDPEEAKERYLKHLMSIILGEFITMFWVENNEENFNKLHEMITYLSDKHFKID